MHLRVIIISHMNSAIPVTPGLVAPRNSATQAKREFIIADYFRELVIFLRVISFITELACAAPLGSFADKKNIPSPAFLFNKLKMEYTQMSCRYHYERGKRKEKSP